jgi:predicted metallo-beta-lactamase superfamily hydrolase
MKVVPLAADSLGVRSMATYVEAGRTGVLIDPGACLAPSRFNLPPADAEWEALKRANDRIGAYGERAGIVVITHYHDDHFRHEPSAYTGRWVLAKDPRRMIAGQQARRASELWRTIGRSARFETADGREHDGVDLSLRISQPLPHGMEGSTLGYVVAVTLIDHAEHFRFVFASDVQGPLSAVATAYLIRERPHLLYLSGPPSYLEAQVGTQLIDRGIENLRRVMDATGCQVLMDHYALRDGRAVERFARLWETGKAMTAAGYLGLPETALESKRAALWATQRKPPARLAGGRAPGRGRAIVARTPFITHATGGLRR